MAVTSAFAARLVAATDAHEGPVHVPEENALYFTTSRPHVAIRRVDLASGRVTTVRDDANAANGMALGRDGRLVVCEQGAFHRAAAITAVDRATGAAETLVDEWHGLPLNSPNDVVVAGDGGIWFTDPSYGHVQGFRPQPVLRDRVYRFDPATSELSGVAAGCDKPNGLAFSPAQDALFVGDNGASHELVRFDVVGGRRLARRRPVAAFPAEHPDGLAVDAAGRVYASTPDGVRVLASDGETLAEIELPGAVNFTWREPDRRALYVTADSAIWLVEVAQSSPSSRARPTAWSREVTRSFP
jgi:gluconolactonase